MYDRKCPVMYLIKNNFIYRVLADFLQNKHGNLVHIHVPVHAFPKSLKCAQVSESKLSL